MDMLNNRQDGAISMLTVIFLAILLTIITTSFVRLSVTEQRQAIDDDLTTRAFYAAESGVEDAKRAISDFQDGLLTTAQLNGDSCDPASGFSGDLDIANQEAEYTCQLIELSPANFQDELDPWEAITIPLNGAAAFSSIRIDWHTYNGPPYGRHGDKQLLTTGAWASANYPAMLRAAIFSHPATASFSANSVLSGTVFINPGTAAEATNVTTHDGQIRNGGCQASPASGSYACSITISGINSSRTNYLRLQSLYRATNVQVTLVGTLFEDVQAIIDVTARANDVFRRVEARVSLVTDEFPLPDIALWSNTDICKNFTITNDPVDYSNSCPWAP